MPPRPSRRDLLLVALLLLHTAVLATAWTLLDRRPPDDHDDFYTASSIPAVLAWRAAEGPADKARALAQHWRSGELHPRLATSALVVTLGTFGPSRAAFRLAGLPFLLVFVLGTWLLAREPAGPRLALLAAWIVSTAPIVLNASRKWDIQFHAAALVPVALWLLIRALRAERPRGWVAAAGLAFGLRFYGHPILLPDVAVTLALAAALSIPLARARGLRALALLPRVAAIAGIALGVGLYYLGWAGDWIGEPGWSFRHYLAQRVSYVDVDESWLGQADLLARLGLAVDMLREVIWLHTGPSTAVLLLPGVIALPWAVLRRTRAEDGPELRERRWSELLLLGAVSAQAPAAYLAAANHAFINDWLFVAPAAVTLALLAMAWSAPRVPRRVAALWVGLLIANGAAHAWVPLLAGVDPIEDWERVKRSPLAYFTYSSSGRALTTHHLPLRSEEASTTLAKEAARVAAPGRPARIALLDLTWDSTATGRPGCRLGRPEHRASWSWVRPAAALVGDPQLSSWPFVFEGLAGVEVVEPPGDPVPAELPRLALVRLWLRPTEAWLEDASGCEPRARIPSGFLAAARARAAELVAADGSIRVLPDPTARLIGTTVEWTRGDAYLGVALLVDRGASGPLGLEAEEDAYAELVRQAGDLPALLQRRLEGL